MREASGRLPSTWTGAVLPHRETMRSFILIGGRASADSEFRLDDFPSTSGRLDVQVRSLRAALLVSHGVRKDVVVYLVLRGGPRAPRVVRVRGAEAKFLRPDERSLAVLVKKSLATELDLDGGGFAGVRPGIAVARGDLALALDDVRGAALFVLEEHGADLREARGLDGDAAFVLGDHVGFDDTTRALLREAGAVPVSVGPRSLHTEDVVTIATNELDRRASRG